MGRVRHEVLYDQITKISGWIRQSHFEYIPEKLNFTQDKHKLQNENPRYTGHASRAAAARQHSNKR